MLPKAGPTLPSAADRQELERLSCSHTLGLAHLLEQCCWASTGWGVQGGGVVVRVDECEHLRKLVF